MDANAAPVPSIYLSKEVKIGNEVLQGLTTIIIDIPSTGTNTLAAFNLVSRPQRHVITTRPIYKGEEDYVKSSLAKSGSIFFSSRTRYPRSIQWRTIKQNQVLELRSVDLIRRDAETNESVVIIQLAFPSPIREGCIALADTDDQDTFSLFVISKDLELRTFTLKRGFFCHPTASEEEVRKWCKTFRPASFTISTPYRLAAENSLQVIVSLSDGRLLNLTRKVGDDGSSWHETAYSDGRWTSLLSGLVRWQGSNAVQHDGVLLDPNTAASLALSPNKQHAYAVCLNHTMRVWSLNMPKSVFFVDLLGQQHDVSGNSNVTLDPGSFYKIQIFQAEEGASGDQYYVMTFSPGNLGRFKIWGVRDPDEPSIGIRDMYPEYALRPPDPDPSPESKAIWKVSDFYVKSTNERNGTELWVLMRSSKQYRLYNLNFDLEDVGSQWQNDWSMTVLETLDQHPDPYVFNNTSEDVNDAWLDLLLYPGRFSDTILETAMMMYSAARNTEPLSDAKAPIKERLFRAVKSRCQLRQNDEGDIDFQKYQDDISQEWFLYWQYARDLNSSRWGVISIVYDAQLDGPGILFADGFSIVRDCDRLEILANNTPLGLKKSMHLMENPSIELGAGDREQKLPQLLAVIVAAAASFTQAFDYRLIQTYRRILATELWQDPLYSAPNRIHSLYDLFEFEDEIADNEIANLEASLEPIGGYHNLSTGSFLAIIDELSDSMSGELTGLSSTKLGLKVLSQGSLDMVDLHEQTLLSLLLLLVFINREVDTEENPLENFDGVRLYLRLIDQLKKCHLMQWLGRNFRVWNDRGVNASSRTNRDVVLNSNSDIVSSVLENLFAIDTEPQLYAGQSQKSAVTQTIQDVLKWCVGGNDASVSLDRVLVHIQCDLLKNDNINLATDFLRFQPSTAWATYIRGRLCFLKGEIDQSAVLFKKAAFKLSRRVDGIDYASASNGLLSSLDAEFFGRGLSTYYIHILTLFETVQRPSYVATFAQLALQFTPVTEREQINACLRAIFDASLSMLNFPTAFSALLRHHEPSTLLPNLISAMLAENAVEQLFSFPFAPDLQSQVDDYFCKKARTSPITTSLTPSASRYYQTLSAWRIHHGDVPGAAASLLERLDRLVLASSSSAGTTEDSKEASDRDPVLDGYLAIINLLRCCKSDAWVLYGGNNDDDDKDGQRKHKRSVVTLADVRKRYQAELDRRSVIENCRFGFTMGSTGEAMDVL